ncbi:MAG: hypothetical protein K9N00_05350 [Candidatus Marinimicrobia bacterium]|nr:hypothetical protein [Candidatus Neomarinimicrobiota bacterium]
MFSKNRNNIMLIGFMIILINCQPSEKFDVYVSDGLQPTISWNYSLDGINSIYVKDITLDTNIVLWHINTNDNFHIYSPIKYGDYSQIDTNKIGAHVPITSETDSLISGRMYRVDLWYGNDHGKCEFIAKEKQDSL